MVDLSPTRGREQDGVRPAMVLSVDKFNHGPADLLIVLPITTTQRKIPTHVPVPMGEAGLSSDSYIKCEDIRSISKDRLVSKGFASTQPLDTNKTAAGRENNRRMHFKSIKTGW